MANTPQNSGSVTVDVAGMAPPLPSKEDCEELGKQNEKTRENLDDKTSDKSLMGATGEQEGTTVSSSAFTRGGGQTSVMTAHSSGKALEKLEGGLAPGASMEQRATGKSNLCDEFKHAPPYKQKSGHTEARLLDSTFASNPGQPLPGQMVLSIDWRPRSKPGTSSKMPCKDCHKVLCAASACGIKIYLCDKDNQPQELTECPPDEATYTALEKKLDKVSILDD